LGKIAGLDRKEYPSVAEFRGIPYAEPPLRWQPPKMHKGWGGDTFNATDYGSICFQNIYPGGLETEDDPQSEDCLLLQIATPRSALEVGAKKLPVMLWIHGGGFRLGKGWEFDAAPLVDASGGEVVVVQLNYRLGVFGYLGGDELMSRTNGTGAGNFGTQDQRMAMKWVKENIGAFGGDGDDVTLFGQSAGAMSILNHLSQPESYPLYNKVIVESGSQLFTSSINITINDANMKYNAFLNGTGCEDIDCLLEVGAKELLDLYEYANAAPSYWGWLPVIDGVSVTEFFLNLFESKLFNNNVPIIIGTNREEAAGYMNIPSNNLTEGEFESLIQTYTPMSTEELTELKQLYDPQVYSYPAELGEYSIWAWMYARAQTDMMVTAELGLPGHCQDRWLARKLLEGGSKSVYMYQWAHTPNTVSEVFAAHGYEPFNVYNMLVYPIWKAQQTGNLTYIDDATAARVKMGRAMSAYWSSFAVSGDPSTTRDESELGMVQWPKFTTEQELTFMLEDDSKGGLRVEQHLLKEQCDWHLQYANSVGEYLPLKSEILMTSSATKHSMLMMLMTLMTLIQ
jgi:para-nitrobenzyl esterase